MKKIRKISRTKLILGSLFVLIILSLVFYLFWHKRAFVYVEKQEDSKVFASFSKDLIFDANVEGFFEKEKLQLSSQLDNFFNSNSIPRMIVVPHAGYAYSGHTAAKGYEVVKPYADKIKTVILIGPAHKSRKNGVAFWTEQGSWQTALGEVLVDTAFAKALKKNFNVEDLLDNSFYESEHSLKVQIPFLQKILPSDFSIVPILITSLDLAMSLANSIYELTQKSADSTLIVISTDLSHYKSKDLTVSRDLDAAACIASLDTKNFVEKILHDEIEACGAAAVLTAMFLAKMQQWTFETISYSNSADSFIGNPDSVVGYLSAAFYEIPLLKEHEDFLLNLALNKVYSLVKRDDKNKFFLQGSKDLISQTLNISIPAKVFVTLKSKDRLRGCIGNLGEPAPLAKTVVSFAQAALSDSRFLNNPIGIDDLKDLSVEISILSDEILLKNPLKEIKLGMHGVILRKNGRSAVFLPEVALEQNWSLPETLEQLCLKAGLDKHNWQQDAQVSVFTSKKFSF